MIANTQPIIYIDATGLMETIRQGSDLTLLETYDMEELVAISVDVALNCIQRDIEPEDYFEGWFPKNVMMTTYTKTVFVHHLTTLTECVVKYFKLWQPDLCHILTTTYHSDSIYIAPCADEDIGKGRLAISILRSRPLPPLPTVKPEILIASGEPF